MRTVIIVISFLLLGSCEQPSCRDGFSIDKSEVTVAVQRLEEELFSLQSQGEVAGFLRENLAFTQLFLHGDQYPSDEVLAEKLQGLVEDPYIDTLYQEAAAEYADFDPVRRDIEDIFGRLKTLYPFVKTPRVQTAVTGLYNDLFISDSLIVIGLDFFIGEQATYKPRDIPEYILNRYDKQHLPAVIAKFMAGSFIASGDKSTLLSEMIDFGKTYFLASRLLPCTPDSVLMGYTPKDMLLITENEAIIWANFVENEILYETSHITKRKFLGERPNVHEINKDCPGRIGAWVGWQIVESYMKKNNVEIKELLEETNNEKIFSQSGYKPGGR